MSTRNLDALFKPKAVAVVGASPELGSVAKQIASTLAEGEFSGDLWMLNRNYQAVAGVTCYPGFKELPGQADLVIVTAPPRKYASIAAKAAAHGARAILFMAAPDSLGRSRSRRLRRSLDKLTRETGIRILGPNCHGLALPNLGLHASFSRATPKRGRLAFISQSGGIATSVLDWASARDIGFSSMVALGDRLDVDEAAALDYFAEDPDSDAILIYLEHIGSGPNADMDIAATRRFLSAARAAARIKPVVVMKAERYRPVTRNGLPANVPQPSQDAIYTAALRRAGALRVNTLSELFDAAGTLAAGLRVAGDRLAILANGHGLSVIGEDALLDEGGTLAELNEATRKKLHKLSAPGRTAEHTANIGHDADGERYAKAIALLKDDPGVDGILLLHTPNAVISPINVAEQVVAASAEGRKLPVLSNWLGETNLADARSLFTAAGLPNYPTPNRAVRGFMHLLHYQRAQKMLRETPPAIPDSFSPDYKQARRIIDASLRGRSGTRRLNLADAFDLLASYRLPVSQYEIARTPQEATEKAATIPGPIVLKALSDRLANKTAHGGVTLNLVDDDAVQHAAQGMRERLSQEQAEADVGFQGFILQPMISELDSLEISLRAVDSHPFGPVLLIETHGEPQVALPPLNLSLARAILDQSLTTAAGRTIANISHSVRQQLELCLVQLAQLIVDYPEISEASLDPLLVSPQGLTILDARVQLTATENQPQDRLAIRPYPAELEQTIKLENGQALQLRPVRPQDHKAIHTWFGELPSADIYKRFFHNLQVSSELAARLAQVDYDREIALLLIDPETKRIAGESRLVMETNLEQAQFAIIISPQYRRVGLGRILIEHILDYARQRHLQAVAGEVLANNLGMLALCAETGFEITPSEENSQTMIVTHRL